MIMYSAFITCILLYIHIATKATVANSVCKAFIEKKMADCERVTTVVPQKTIHQFCSDSMKRNNTCTNGGICSKHFKLAIFQQQLFVTTLRNVVREMLASCCPVCAKCSIVAEIEDTSHFKSSFNFQPDVIFPVISESRVREIHGFHFIPVFRVPRSFYFTLKKTNQQIMKEMVMACLLKWPFFLVCLLLASLSGCIIWVLETRKNNEHFRRHFVFGFLDGFWWSFVSMTTVGYGDQIPKTTLGRAYAVLWILIGISMCGMFTASLTTDILNAKTPANTDIAGKTVGVLKQRLHDTAIIAQHGGSIRESSIHKTVRGINELLIMLENKTIHGFLIDRNSYSHFIRSLMKAKFKFIADRYQKVETVQTEKFLHADKLQCGLLIKDKEVYEYMKAFFVNNRLQRATCNSLRMNTNTKKQDLIVSSTLLLSAGNLFEHVIYYMLAILAFVILVGGIYECTKYHITHRSSRV